MEEERKKKKRKREEGDEKRREKARKRELMNIMWPISQSHFHVSHLCSLKCNIFIIILL